MHLFHGPEWDELRVRFAAVRAAFDATPLVCALRRLLTRLAG